MKANELMIGDWVGYYSKDQIKGNPHPLQIYEIRNKSITLVSNGLYQVADLNELSPIPLTPEILEKNGFKEYNSYGYAGNKGYCFAGFYINYDFTTRIANIDCKFNYIHELQHALRLCQINKEIVL